MGDLSGLPVQVFGIFVHFDSYALSRLDIYLLLLPKSVKINKRWDDRWGWNIHVPNFLSGGCTPPVLPVSHWVDTGPDGRRPRWMLLFLVTFFRWGEARWGAGWSYLGHASVVSAMSTMVHRKYSTGASLTGYKMILCYFGRIPGEMLWKMLHMST